MSRTKATTFQKYLKYVRSEDGRRVVIVCSTVGASVVGGVYLGCQTFFLEKYRNAIQLYKNGMKTPVHPQVLARAKEVLAEMNLGTKSSAYIRFFNVFGFDPYSIGSTQTRHGAYIGIPAHFEYKTLADIEKNSIRVGDSPVSWTSDEGELLQKSLILSENAQKFAIARQIAHAETNHIYTYTSMHIGSIVVYIVLSNLANEAFYGLYKPASFRFTVYTLIGSFAFGVWAVGKDLLTKYYENYADKRASSLGINYAKGGAEFYTRIIQRNIALRSLLGSDGEARYTQFGNDTEFLRQKHVAFSVRKQNAEDFVKLYSSSSQGDSEAEATSLKQ